ncbi:Cohesin complex subunit SA-1/2 [Gigaspora margarita]|uniref:Cohesin complex subunit SA-1/2 n=1 Tax=Gigaspora margarita TaxID=4874 RepID=A0A8H4A7E5_GIGMA|nr:Cohesin complex subunit SA-1/2 [Gigaspora margarita]
MSTNGFSHEIFEESGLSLYEAIFDQGDTLGSVASEWVNMYKEETDNQTNSLLSLINFIIRSCGCSEIIAKEGFEKDDEIPTVLEELQDAFKKELVADYPLISKSREFRKFRRNFLTFFKHLMAHIKHDVLYDGVFFETLQIWVVPMSSSSFRPFRHTATIIALHLYSCLCEIAQEVHDSWTIASRQLTVEKRTKSPRNSKNMDRIIELQSKTQDLDNKKKQLDVYFEELFDSVFVHRYRDVEAIIRAECIKELGIWVTTYPSRFLDDTNVRYLGWQLSDKSPIVRLESIKVLEQLYTNETFVNGLRNFTSRFKPRLLEMALREIDINVRIASIQILTTIYNVGMLDTEDCDQLSLLIYCDVTRVRKTIASFVKETLEDDFIREKMTKVQTFIATNGGTKRKRVNGNGSAMGTVKKEWVAFKCLAEFLVKYAKVIDDAQKGDRIDDQMEEDEEEFEDGILTQSIGDVENSRISLAIQDLWTELDLLHQWQKLADYLSKDHSLINQSRTSKGGGISADTIEECYRLSEQEESVLIQVFVKCLQLILSDNAAKDKKKAENHIDETRDEISRSMVTILPKLLTKYAPDASRIAEVLRITILMNMDVYSDLRIHKAYEVLVEDIVKLYLKHTNPIVLSHAAATFLHMKKHKNFASMTETRLGELQEEVIKTFLGECEDKDLLTMDLTSDQVHSLYVALSRLEQLITIVNFVDAAEVCDENNKSVYNCIIRLVRRGLLGNIEEEKIVSSAINFLWYYILWKVSTISPNETVVEDISLDVLNDIIVKRDQIVQTLFEVGISYGSQALHNVKSMAFRTFGNMYWLFSSDMFHHSNGTNLSELKLSCQSDLQDRIADFVEEEITSFRESYTEAESKLEQEIRKEEEEEEDASEQDGEKTVKRSINVDMFINPEERTRIMDIIGALLRGVRGGWLNVSHAAVVICNYGTIGCDLDDVIKKLLLEFKERISSGDDAKLFASVCMKSLRKSQFLYVDGKVRTMNATMSLARICGNTLQLRDTSDKSSHKDMDYVVELHRSGIQHICSMINAYQLINDTEGKECLVKSIQFFKVLTRLFGGITCNDAQKIESILKEEFEKNKIQVVESEKLWESYILYIQKMNTILVKGGARKEQTVSESSKKRTINNKSSSLEQTVSESSKKRTVNNKKRRRTSDSRRNTKDHYVNEEKTENDGSDSEGSYQSLPDVRRSRRIGLRPKSYS